MTPRKPQEKRHLQVFNEQAGRAPAVAVAVEPWLRSKLVRELEEQRQAREAVVAKAARASLKRAVKKWELRGMRVRSLVGRKGQDA